MLILRTRHGRSPLLWLLVKVTSNVISFIALMGVWSARAAAQPLPADSSSVLLPQRPHAAPAESLGLAQGMEMADGPPRVLPRVGVTWQSGPGTGYDRPLGTIYGFVPWGQTLGMSTWYGEGRASGFTGNGGWQGNLRLGYRSWLPDSDLVWGGYIGWDMRQTAFDKTFHQLGLGLDLQGDDWEIRANGYVPLGDTRRQVAATGVSNTATSFVNPRFTGNQLLVTQSDQQTTVHNRRYEALVGGFDLEAGYQLMDWDGGSLSAYGGMYYLTVPEESAFVGGRGRLQLLLDNFQTGMAIQSDGYFGTNVVFNVGLSWGGSGTRQRDETLAEPVVESVVARLGSGVQRQETLAIAQQQEMTTTVLTTTNEVVATNPASGAPWRFLHVTDGATGGTGTVENPLSEVTDGVAIAATAGNDIIYVDAGDRSGLNGFTIPANVQVLSSGVSQVIGVSADSTLDSTITLPASGSRPLPLLNGATVTTGGLTGVVAMGNNSTLSGFDIRTTDANNNGVVARNINTPTIDRNQITTTGDSARGIFLNTDSMTLQNATISGNRITTAGNDAYGIYTYARGGSALETLTLTGNTIATSGDTGKGTYIKIRDNSTLETLTISGNTIATSGNINAFGIHADASVATIETATISGNTVSITGSGIPTGSSGIYVRAQNNRGTINQATVSGNTVTTTGNYGDGIVVTAGGPDATISRATISGNTIATQGNYADSISLATFNGPSTIAHATVTNNRITQAGVHSVIMQVRNDSEIICIAEFADNTSSSPGASGAGGNDLRFNPSAGTPGPIRFVDFANLSANNVGFDDVFVANGNVIPVTSCP